MRTHRIALTVPLYLPQWLCCALRTLKRKLVSLTAEKRATVNLLGDRDIEWSWVASQMPSGPGEALDFGPGGNHLALIAAQRGFNVTAVDLQPVHWTYVHRHLCFIRGDISEVPLPKENFDLVINCSTVEHVGLAGRYGVAANRLDGDLEAMNRLRNLMRLHGVMLLTIPVGKDSNFAPLHRVYGAKRLPRLLDGYAVEREQYWVKNNRNQWVLSDKQAALAREPQPRLYGLGCFVLRRARV